MYEDETIAFWLTFTQHELAERCAILHKQRRQLADEIFPARVFAARQTIAEVFLRGTGLEIGAGDRPFPVPAGVNVRYGDFRDEKQTGTSQDAAGQLVVDAQTLHGIDDNSQDFVISAHVIEHLWDPVGSIVQTMRVLRPGGVFILVVSDKRYTMDAGRPEITVEHAAADFKDGGCGTRRDAYREHLLFVHPRSQPAIPANELESLIDLSIAQNADIHIHAWTKDEFAALLDFAATKSSFRIEATVSIVNENIFVLRKPA